MIIQALLIVLASYLIYGLFKYSDRAIGTNARPELPGPKGQPLIGNLSIMRQTSDKMLDYMTSLSKEYGIGFTITQPFGIRLIDISRPDLIEYVQKTNFNNYVKGSLSRKLFADVFGATGIFIVDSTEWYIQRKATAHIFTNSSFDGIISETIADDLVKLNKILTLKSQQAKEFDLSALFFAFTLDSFVKMAFSEDIGTLSESEESQAHPFSIAFDYCQAHSAMRIFNPFWKLTENFSKGGKKMKESVKIMNDYAYGIIDRRKFAADEKKLKGSSEKGESGKDLLGIYMATNDSLTRTALRDSILNIIIAGRDTTAQTLSWTFYRLMASDPKLKLLEIIREEIDRLGNVDYRNYKDFVQVHAAFNEGLRLHPSVPKSARTCLQDDQIPNGPKIYAGERVRWSDWSMARDPAVWGEDCAEYKPARWINSEGGLIRESQYKFHAFNGGPRLCLGMNLANFEGISVMVEILRSYDLSFAPGYLENVERSSTDGTPMYVSSLTLPMKNAFRVLVKERKL